MPLLVVDWYLLKVTFVCERACDVMITLYAVTRGDVVAYHALYVFLHAEVIGLVNALAANAEVELAQFAEAHHVTGL